MHKLCRIDIGKREEIFKEIERFSRELKERFGCDRTSLRKHLTLVRG